MKILIIKSSYRSGSNSSALADKVAEGAQVAGAVAQVIDIGRLTINNCRSCYACINSDNFCVVHDDMYQFYQPVADADVIIFASPVHWFNISGQAKQFIDRLLAVAVLPRAPFSTKGFAALFSFEDADAVRSGCVNALRMFQDMCSMTKARWMGALYCSADKAGEAAARPDLMAEAYIFGENIVKEFKKK
ncbi:MAG: flavodoxin family protein [Deferribacteraceae bacterium]|jgi:multimeric flavodoxin WrbA|nr:flavodoxin family protein [Deferribacteraceae bacterium]